ncbi:hypothetical protein KKD19_02150 [Patescibacteria group bacterium]|nr:hypothetical protein [Patescibacteria group bacterium]MBU4512027.1 hypothetical protein [Patescibacteria group bacterium]MCG2693196.1 hypothetical protein [Candidatus Parcubacteria bacterium]
MKIEIDQSGKIEDTNRLTVVAFANGKVKSLKISSVEKQKLVKAMRALDYPKKTFIFKIFAGLIYLLLRDEKNIDEVIIDREYPGQEGVIKDVLSHLFRKFDRQTPLITFHRIGKKGGAHKIANDIYKGKRAANIVVTANRVFQILYN